MIEATELRQFTFDSERVWLYVPDQIQIKAMYESQKAKAAAADFPYWSQVWPAASGLCEFLVNHVDLIQGKKVLELGAGLGLPSLLASRFAREVLASDYNRDAVVFMQRSAEYNGIKNMNCKLLDWNNLPPELSADTVLVSDVNYDPGSFDMLRNVLMKFLSNRATIVLSTPQRLMAKPFIDRLLLHSIHHDDAIVDHVNGPVAISIHVLKQNKS